MKKKLLLIVLSVAVAAFTASVAAAGGPANEPGADQGPKGQPVVVKGKIAHMERLGGYYVKCQDPPGDLMIENQNPALLEKLLKNGKTVTIKGRFRIGADFLFIEKIDGQAYRGK